MMADLPSIIAHDAEAPTPVNPPFQSRIAYRADDYSTARFKLLRHVAEAFPGWNSTLAANRGEQDLAVAFAELASYLVDVLGFYQDCRANESFVRTATLTSSLIELAALVDYRLHPGASASTLQVFIAKEGQRGTLAGRFKVETKAKGDKPALVFETGEPIEIDAARNVLRLNGYDRSSRRLNVPGLTADTSVRLDAGYSGLKAGSFAVFVVAGGTTHAVQLTAVTEEDDRRRIHWNGATAALPQNLQVADLTILGKPKQTMRLAASARADELTAGQQSAAVATPSVLDNGDAVLFVSEGLRLPARIVTKSGSVVTWNRSFPISLRRSSIRIYRGRPAQASASSLRAGATSVTTTTTPFGAGNAPIAGDYMLLSGDGVLEVALVAQVASSTFYFAEPLVRAVRGASGITLYRIRLDNPETGATGSPSTPLRPLRTSVSTSTLTLDSAYEGLEKDNVLVISDQVEHRVVRVESVTLDAEGRTVLTLSSGVGAEFAIAATALYGPFEHTMRVDGFNRAEGSLAAGQSLLTLSAVVPDLRPGWYLVVEGGGHAEGGRITAVSASGGRTVVNLERALQQAYPLADMVVHGNVTPVTHGATVVEQMVGSGDRSQGSQRFALRRSPTSYVHDGSAARGVRSTLEIFVDDERWQEVASLAESSPDDRHYMVEVDENEVTSVRFGDGRYGARLSTGRDNVRARYRVGQGAAGSVAADAIVQIPEAPPFLDTTRNPIPASGGADRERPADTKRYAPMAMHTLDRAVSLSDYADLALAFAGIAKARAEWGWAARRREVVVTVASVGGSPLTPSLSEALRGYLEGRRLTHHRLRIRDYRLWPVRLAIDVDVKPTALRTETLVRVRQALGDALTPAGEPAFFHFDRVALGRDLYLSDVYAIVEGVAGVGHVVATAFHPEGPAPAASPVLDRIAVPPDAVASGGHASDASRGILYVTVRGGIA
jgi:hypothetical protein